MISQEVTVVSTNGRTKSHPSNSPTGLSSSIETNPPERSVAAISFQGRSTSRASGTHGEWHGKTLEEKLLAYRIAYQTTGYIDFSEFEIVARMAAEGAVLVPDVAEDRIAAITSHAEQIHSLSLQLQDRLDTICSIKVYEPGPIRVQLTQLDQRVNGLAHAVEQQVIPVAPLVNLTWNQQMRSHLSELTGSCAHLLDQLEFDITRARNTSKVELQPQIHQLTQISSIAQKLCTYSVEIIRARTPFYLLS